MDSRERVQSIIENESLDPSDWSELRAEGHRMLDDMFDYIENIRERPVWQPIPEVARKTTRGKLPHQPSDLASVHQVFMDTILPYSAGNVHPGFMGWVQGGGTPVGMLAEMVSAGLNANLGGRDQMPIEIERQVAGWMRDLFGFPKEATGVFVTGTSMANLIGVLVARTAACGIAVRRTGVNPQERRLVSYASAGAHSSISQALEIAGFGSTSFRLIPMNERFEMDLCALERAIENDRREGFEPFLVLGTAGSVDVGAIDDLSGIADIAAREELWFHVDGAFGALAMLASDIAPRLAGIERADSLAFDFHKWGQVPYDAGFALVRDGALHRRTFASSSPYLARANRAMNAGSPWPCDFGPDLSRSFRALKTWFTFKVYGSDRIGAAISRTCSLAQYMRQTIEANPELELRAPVALNIVCFRFRVDDGGEAIALPGASYSDSVNSEICALVQESGIAAPSTTLIRGRLAIRAAIVNHRTASGDIDALLSAVVQFGRSRVALLRKTS